MGARQAGRRFFFLFFPPPHRADKASRLVLTRLRHRLSAAHCLFNSKTLESQRSFIHERQTMRAQWNLGASLNGIFDLRRRLVEKTQKNIGSQTALCLFLPTCD